MIVKIALGIIVYIVAAILLNAGPTNADFRAAFPTLCTDPRWAKHNQAFAIGWGLLPPAFVLTPFMTGFYVNGWTLSGAPCQ